MKDILNELSWRGLIQDKVFGIEYIIEKKNTIYIGFDPTASSLHIGSLLPIIILIHFQKMGYQPIVIIGEGTGLIGDPSGKEKERPFLDTYIIKKNAISIKDQILKLFRFFSKEKKVELLNNFDWIQNISFLEFVREIGIYLTVNYMISKDSVKNRIRDKKKGMSFSELSYAIVQGYDFYFLNKTRNCQLQIGGSDQWGNILTGIELIRKKTGKSVYGFTFPLITKSNGRKFGKSEKKNNIWIDPVMTLPYKFYQYWINVSDNEAKKFIKMYTFFSKKRIHELTTIHVKKPQERLLQKTLAKEITTWVHGKQKTNEIIEITHLLFNKKLNYFSSLKNKRILSLLYNHLPHMIIFENEFGKGILLSDFLKKTDFFSSKKKVFHAIKNHSIYLNNQPIKENFLIKKKDMIGNKYLLFQFGKKEFFITKIKS
ncbi:tyrosine--tRNA ligase [Blattabacterium cuenoti]|uniref:tyrosine--tRNA ligase n=1 Tax=Blattabacterium cuenoti TaxID=1653831 RepID=UPI00163B9E52|nr:tyrosine--tRNA ligase [Blattabacterium cuenoti]